MDMKISFPGGKQIYAEYAGFEIRTDQGPQGGGEGSAPEPFMLFLSSIGTCAGIYVLSFCQQRGLDTEGLEIIQSMEYDYSKRLIGRINLEIKTPASVPEKYHKAIVKSANLCAVKKHMENPPEFNVFTSAV